jgi:cation diffusion facilitator CzcD-associated flavoprotein CzcO
MPPERFDAVVVGAGPAGLATSRELARRGVRHLVLERGDAVGWSWRQAYDSLTLHTGKHLSALPGLGFGRAAPLFLPRDAFVEYLLGYAAHFSLPVRTRCDLRRARRSDGEWVLETGAGEIRAGRLVLATGIMANPHRPEFPGGHRFGGRVLHSVEYRAPEPFIGRRVLVVGVGNSAGEIASELTAAGAEVTLSVRSGTNVVPLRLFGIPIQYWAAVVMPLPRPARAQVVGLVQRITELRRGPPVLPQPSVGPLDSIPLIGFHLVDAIRAGKVRVCGGITELTERGARFDDGTETTVDDVLLATGFRAAVGPVRDLIDLDGRGFARRRDRVVVDGPPDLYVVGHNYDATGGLYNIRRDAPRAAHLVARADG